jgi:hypothetical protein
MSEQFPADGNIIQFRRPQPPDPRRQMFEAVADYAAKGGVSDVAIATHLLIELIERAPDLHAAIAKAAFILDVDASLRLIDMDEEGTDA